MSDKKESNNHKLEETWIRDLAGILEETGLTEIEIEKDDVRLRVSRQGGVATFAPVPAVAPPPATGTPAAPTATPANEHPGAVKSPMVGTAYLSATPGAEPFVKEGAQVTEGQTILIIEAMKTMNPIAAPRSGKVVKVLVKDAQPIEFDEPLLIIE